MCTRTFYTRVLEGHTNLSVWEFKSIPLFTNADILFVYSHVTLLKPKIKETKILQLFILEHYECIHDHMTRIYGVI